MTRLLELPEDLAQRRRFGVHDDFDTYVTTQRWTSTLDSGGSVALDADGVGGVLAVTTDIDDNDEAYAELTVEMFKFAADKPILFEARTQFSEAATDDANILVGLMDAPGADTLLDDGGGVKSSYSGAVFYKTDGTTVWHCQSSIGTSRQTTVTETTAGGSAYQTLRIAFQPITATTGEVRFFINDELVAKHDITFSSATEMSIALGSKAGGANAETLNVDYVSCHQLR